MSSGSNWSAIPPEVLQRAFELQQNGLANCAAARSCITWRDVARRSHVNSLHLHADTDDQEQFWHQLLTARPSVDTLKLDRAVLAMYCSSPYAANSLRHRLLQAVGILLNVEVAVASDR